MNHTCMVCECGPHRNRDCPCGCKTWVNAAARSALALTSLNNLLAQEIPKLIAISVDIVELLAEVHPEATKRIDERRAENRKKLEEQKEDTELKAFTDKAAEQLFERAEKEEEKDGNQEDPVVFAPTT